MKAIRADPNKMQCSVASRVEPHCYGLNFGLTQPTYKHGPQSGHNLNGVSLVGRSWTTFMRFLKRHCRDGAYAQGRLSVVAHECENF